jgi:hypothetical protein
MLAGGTGWTTLETVPGGSCPRSCSCCTACSSMDTMLRDGCPRGVSPASSASSQRLGGVICPLLEASWRLQLLQPPPYRSHAILPSCSGGLCHVLQRPI